MAGLLIHYSDAYQIIVERMRRPSQILTLIYASGPFPNKGSIPVLLLVLPVDFSFRQKRIV
jgi:hypothetical protein